MIERHQVAQLTGVPADVMVAPETEHYVHFDAALATKIRRLRATHVHSFGPLIDPRWSPSFSTTQHDLTRWHIPSLQYEDGEVVRRAGYSELSRMVAFNRWCRDHTSNPKPHGESEHSVALEFLEALVIRSARFICTISEASAADLTQHWRYPPEMIEIVPPTVKSFPYPAVDPLRQFNLPTDYLLFVGTPDEQKRLDLVCRALWATEDLARVQIVVVGDMGAPDLAARLLRHPTSILLRDPRIIRLGYVDDGVLGGLYRDAIATIVPSLSEGFGLPAVEAAVAGGEIIVNRTPALQEALRGVERTFWFDVWDDSSIVTALRQVVACRSGAHRTAERSCPSTNERDASRHALAVRLLNCALSASADQATTGA